MTRSSDSVQPTVDLDHLLSLFYSAIDLGDLAHFAAAHPPLPAPFDSLLNHQAHMTVTVESHFNSTVDVEILRLQKSEKFYAREILLRSRSSRAVVQYGIVKLRVDLLAPAVWREIEGGAKPLGRVLIDHQVMRQVELVELWNVKMGRALAKIFTPLDFSSSIPESTYGRTARILCDSEPAIELLEIVTPLDWSTNTLIEQQINHRI